MKLTCGTCENLFPVQKKTTFVYNFILLIPTLTINDTVHSVLYCSHCTSVQCVHKLTSQHGDKSGCQSSQGIGHEKNVQIVFVSYLFVIRILI